MWPGKRGARKRGAQCRRPRKMVGFQHLELRRLLVAEGEVFSLSQSMDAIALAGTYSASVNWGDGRTSTATVSPGQLTGKITARIDYSFDSSGFFNAPARRQLLQASVDSIAARLTDTLAAIQPSGSNSWTARFDHPSQAGVIATRNNLTVAENELVIFAGARPMTSPQLGQGGFGGFQASGSSSFLNTIQSRGQGTTSGANANDFGPWGGSITFNTNTNWYFGADPSGIASGQQDFVTVATHEFLHLLGFGVSPSWQRLVSGQFFTGANSRAQYDGSGNVPLSSDRGHWQIDLQDGGAETLMDPNQMAGLRKLPTPLDMAGLRDVGWSLATSSVTVSANHTYADNGQYPISVTLSGSTLGRVTRSLNANITNTPPTLTVVAAQQIAAGQTLSLTNLGQISDPGFRNTAATPPTDETFSYVINWGDNSSNSTGVATIDQIGNATRPTLASFDGSHVYASPGNYTVRVTVTDDDGGSVSRSFDVNVQAAAMLAISSDRSRVKEDGSVGAQLTVTRSGNDLSQAILVNLNSSDLSEATVQSTVTMGPGVAVVTVPLLPVDDDLLDGNQPVTITVSAPGFQAAEIELIVEDVESLVAEAIFAEVMENAGVDAIGFRVARSNTDTASPLNVTITGSNPLLAESISTIVIPAGQQQVQFMLDAVDDDVPELTKRLELNFSADGYVGGSASVAILDNEPPKFQNPVNPLDVDGDGQVIALDALAIINYINRFGDASPLDPEAGLDIPFLDVDGDYFALPLDALQIINALNRGGFGEGEGGSPDPHLDTKKDAPILGFAVPDWASLVDRTLADDEDELVTSQLG